MAGSLPVVVEDAGSVSYGGDSSLYDTTQEIRNLSGGAENDMWEDVSDTSSQSSTGSNYTDGHMGEPASPGTPGQYGDEQGELLSADPYHDMHDPDMGAVSVPRPLSRDSLRGGNVVMTVTIVEMCGYGRDRSGLRKKLEAEWYIKLRLMKPQGRSFVLVDKPYRTEFQRPLNKAEPSDAVAINMQFKFGRDTDSYRIDERLLQTGVLRFKVKCKKFLKFRTMVKSNDVKLKPFVDDLAVGGVSHGPNDQDVQLLDGNKSRAQLRIVIKFSGRQ